MTTQTLEALREVANENDPELMYLALINHIAAGLPEYKLSPVQALTSRIAANKVVFVLAHIAVVTIAVFNVAVFVSPFVR